MNLDDDIRKVMGRRIPLTIAQYLELRENYRPEQIDIWNENGIEFPFWWDQEFDDPFDISTAKVERFIYGDDDSVSSVSLKVLRAIDDRDRAVANSETHLASQGYIEDSFVGMLIAKRFEMMDWSSEFKLNKDFLFLVRAYLRADRSKYLDSLHVYENKQAAVRWARLLVICERPLTVRNLSKLLGVQPSTISRWFPRGLPKFTDGEIRMYTDPNPFGKEGAGPLVDRVAMTRVIDEVFAGKIESIMLPRKPRAQQPDD